MLKMKILLLALRKLWDENFNRIHKFHIVLLASRLLQLLFYRLIYKTEKSDCFFRYVLSSAWKNSASTTQIFMKFCMWVF